MVKLTGIITSLKIRCNLS